MPSGRAEECCPPGIPRGGVFPIDYGNVYVYTASMKITLQIQLLPDPEQKADLLGTMERFNEAATFAAKVGFEAGVYGQVTIHKLAYHDIRERFGLSAQLGFFAFCVAGALVIAAVAAQRPGRFSEESAVIAVVQTAKLRTVSA